jgi:hypothetical protein
MSFTSQRSFAGQQAADARSLPCMVLVSTSAMNWSPVSICLSPVGNRCWQYGLPGVVNLDLFRGSKPSNRMPAQIQVRMKNARKETGVQASDKSKVHDSLMANTPSDPTIFENQVFVTPPSPRQPESPEVESLRSLLKANLTRETASPALLQRIRSRMHENKE